MRADLLGKLWNHLGGLGLYIQGVMDYCGEEIIIVWRVQLWWIGLAYCIRGITIHNFFNSSPFPWFHPKIRWGI